jgi:molecular chaperone HscA
MAKISINIATGSLQKDDVIVGIDLGTTNSLIAIIHPESKQPVALKEHDGSVLVPSIVYFDENNASIVGEEARSYLTTAPERTIFSAKRLLGKNYKEAKTNEAVFSYNIIDDGNDDSQVLQPS